MIVPQQPVPRGGKTLLREEGSPRALLSLKLAGNNRSNLVSSSVKCSPPTRVQPPALVQRAPGAQEQGSRDQLLCSGLVLLMLFPACHWSFCTLSPSEENLFPPVPRENLISFQQEIHQPYLQGCFLSQACSNKKCMYFLKSKGFCHVSGRVHTVVTL